MFNWLKRPTICERLSWEEIQAERKTSARQRAHKVRDNTCVTCAFYHTKSTPARWEPTGGKSVAHVPRVTTQHCEFHDIEMTDITICDVYSYKCDYSNWGYSYYAYYRFEDDTLVKEERF